MIILGLIFIVMLAAALTCVAWPWLRQTKVAAANRQQLNIALYQQRLQELEQDLQLGKLDATQYEQAQAELQQALLQDTSTSEAVIATTNNRELLWWLLAAIPVLAVIMYFCVGGSQDLYHYQLQQVNNQQATALTQQLKTPQAVLARLEQTVAQNPTDPQGWFLLGRLYMDFQRTNDATKAFAHANQLKPNDPDIMLQYAQALFVQNNMRLNTQAKDLLKAVVTQDPNNQGVINLLALDAYSNKHYQQAIDYWQSLLEYNATDSDNYRSLQAAIANAQQKLQGK